MKKNLLQKKCHACEAGVKPFNEEQAKNYLADFENWLLIDGVKIKKEFKFKDFKSAVKFVNKIADIAESEGHHPAIFISYNKVKITLSTHAIKGLSENDFILAAKIDNI